MKNQGTIKFFNESKGFGFIVDANSGKDIFVHSTSIAGGSRGLVEGDQVEFEVAEGKKGPEAKNVVKL
ncbi:cold-shock protein [Pedobacter quisquiliarum]|jgi:CspA family cold shock protein|uniref:Cold-shock protein n=1 Tax=Pedobacter quisquiliarum TaxID=1834438 RepID=A0A916U4I3_9SPHI|nr:cold shock domain-containing protein [Pedobacter quisquiliarum]GGC60349.1 cold-shock protein [Pedobacter quisquiliarum]